MKHIKCKTFIHEYEIIHEYQINGNKKLYIIANKNTLYRSNNFF